LRTSRKLIGNATIYALHSSIMTKTRESEIVGHTVCAVLWILTAIYQRTLHLPGCCCVSNPLYATLLRRQFWPTAPAGWGGAFDRDKAHTSKQLHMQLEHLSASHFYPIDLKIMRPRNVLRRVSIALRKGLTIDFVVLAAMAGLRVVSVLVDRGWYTRRETLERGWGGSNAKQCVGMILSTFWQTGAHSMRALFV
jgi:hypothetical protein